MKILDLTPPKTPNTIRGRIVSIVDGVYKIADEKKHHWHIPRELRAPQIKTGDFVIASWSGKKIVIVDEVYREDIEKTGKRYPFVKATIDKNKKIAIGAVAETKDT